MPIRLATVLSLALATPASAATISNVAGVNTCPPGFYSPACAGPHEGGAEGGREHTRIEGQADPGDHAHQASRPHGHGGAAGMSGGRGSGGAGGGGSDHGGGGGH